MLEKFEQYSLEVLMIKTNRLSDSSHPEIKKIALDRTEYKNSLREKAEGIFYFVRDEIPFRVSPCLG